MNIVIAHDSIIPVHLYGGTERVIWYLGNELMKMGHKVTYLVKAGSECPFADVIFLNEQISLNEQIPDETDIINLHFQPDEKINIPHLITIHGNLPAETKFFANTNFVSENHAQRYGANAFVYNGLNWEDYGKPNLNSKLNYVHFLGKAAWRIKNVRGAIQIAHKNKTQIKVLGGSRINFKMGVRITRTKYAKFYGMVGGQKKNELLNHSKALIFPVLWHEPFGLAIIESLYFGCPVLGTKYGSLPELINNDLGFLSNSISELTENFNEINSFNRKNCHEYVAENFNSKVMAENYLNLYEKILNDEKINKNKPQFKVLENKLF